nr:unnamed protein product [Callosobruchus chinensis]
MQTREGQLDSSVTQP